MVVIKSYPSGISLHIDDEKQFDLVLEEVGMKFEESRRFFKNASVAVSVEGRELSIDEEKLLIQAIEEHSDVHVMCLVGKNEETNKKFVKAIRRIETLQEECNGRFHKGNVLSGHVIESDGNLVIFGNVHKGGTVAAGKNIIVLGELNGEAIAGLSDDFAFITAVRMNPELCRIGSLNYKPGKNGIFDKRKSEACIIYKKSESLVCEVITPEAVASAASI